MVTTLWMLDLSPHMKFVNNVKEVDVMAKGRVLCYSDRYSKPDESGNDGANINFVQEVANDEYRIRTYERMNDIEECPSCGVGSVAVALAAIDRNNYNNVIVDGKLNTKNNGD